MAENVTDWVNVTRKRRSKSSETVQIFVKVDGAKATTMELAPSDKVGYIVKRIQNNMSGSTRDAHVTSGGIVLGRSEELRSYGVTDGSILQVANRMLGGGRHKDKKSEAEKKQVEDPRTAMQGQLEQKSEEHSDDDRSRVIQEEEVNQQLGVKRRVSGDHRVRGRRK